MNITPRIIKNYVEKVSGISDLSVKSRKSKILHHRQVAVKLCRVLCSEIRLVDIGEVFKRDHTSIIATEKSFDNLIDQSYFHNYKVLYFKLKDELSKLNNNKDLKNILKDVIFEDLKRLYKDKQDFYIDEHYSIINKQEKQISRLSNNPMFNKISELNDYEFNKLELLVNNFLNKV